MLSNLFMIFVLIAAVLLIGLGVRDMLHGQLGQPEPNAEQHNTETGHGAMYQWVWCLILSVPILIVLLLWR